MSRYSIAVIAWFVFVFVFMTFVMPLAGWSRNAIDASQITTNFILASVLCAVVLYFGRKELKKNNR